MLWIIFPSRFAPVFVFEDMVCIFRNSPDMIADGMVISDGERLLNIFADNPRYLNKII
jgi:hypothetical protein